MTELQHLTSVLQSKESTLPRSTLGLHPRIYPLRSHVNGSACAVITSETLPRPPEDLNTRCATTHKSSIIVVICATLSAPGVSKGAKRVLSSTHNDQAPDTKRHTNDGTQGALQCAYTRLC